MTHTQTATQTHNQLPITLQKLRRNCRVSQLELSLCLGVSQRHISFVESGRARPSRDLLAAWLQELSAPLFVCNEAMLQAGYAPVYSEVALSDPALVQANTALEHLLCAHDPMPAIVIDAHWNLLKMNRGARWLAGTLMPWTEEMLRASDSGNSISGSASPINMLDLLTHPQGLAADIINLEEAGSALLAHLRHEALSQPTLTPRIDAFASSLCARLGVQFLQAAGQRPSAPTLNVRYRSRFGELALFSMFTTFGTPQDITLASLRVEHMFAADDATRKIFTENA